MGVHGLRAGRPIGAGTGEDDRDRPVALLHRQWAQEPIERMPPTIGVARLELQPPGRDAQHLVRRDHVDVVRQDGLVVRGAGDG